MFKLGCSYENNKLKSAFVQFHPFKLVLFTAEQLRFKIQVIRSYYILSFKNHDFFK